METVNKLLKKQAPKMNRRAAAAANAEGREDGAKGPNPAFVRWASTKNGSRVAVTKEMLAGPAGQVFGGSKGGVASSKMVEEVA
jgi:Ino eighty subunit 2